MYTSMTNLVKLSLKF